MGGCGGTSEGGGGGAGRKAAVAVRTANERRDGRMQAWRRGELGRGLCCSAKLRWWDATLPGNRRGWLRREGWGRGSGGAELEEAGIAGDGCSAVLPRRSRRTGRPAARQTPGTHRFEFSASMQEPPSPSCGPRRRVRVGDRPVVTRRRALQHARRGARARAPACAWGGLKTARRTDRVASDLNSTQSTSRGT